MSLLRSLSAVCALALAPLSARATEAAETPAEIPGEATHTTQETNAPPPPQAEPPQRQTVVTGSRTERLSSESVVATEVINRREIQRSGARDLGELLTLQAGVDTERSIGGIGLRLQGLDPEAVTVLLDGRKVAGRVRGIMDLSRFPLRDIERVEIVKGPAAALYGADAMGGVVNLITRTDSAPEEATFTASYGMRNDVDLRASGSLKRDRYRVRLGASGRGADAYDLDPADLGTTGSAHRGFDVGGGVEVRPTDSLKLRADADYLRLDQNGIDALTTGALFDRRMRQERFSATVDGSLKLRWGELSAGVRHSLFRDQLLMDQRFSRALDSYEAAIERMWEGNAQLDVPLLDGAHLVTFGLEQSAFFLEADRLEGGQGERFRTAAYLQDEWRIAGGRVVLLPGVRVDVDSQFGAHPSPRLAARWQAMEALTVRGAWGTGFRAPSFQELLLNFENPIIGYVVEGNTQLRPERSHGVTLSADFAATEDVTLAASLFRTELSDLIAWQTVAEATEGAPTRFGYRNVERARTQGGEASVRVRVVSGTYVDVGYALTHARDLGTGRLLEGRAVHRGSLQVQGRVRPLQLELWSRLALSSPRRFVRLDGQGDDLTSPTAEWEVRVSRRMFRYLDLFVGGRNLLGAGDPLYVPLPPRQVYGGFMVPL